MFIPNVQQEEGRNRLLRRVDWRFLLPNPQPVRTFCWADPLLTAGVAQISGTVIKGEDGEQATNSVRDNSVRDNSVRDNSVRDNSVRDQCDLAVLVNPDKERLARAWDALQSGHPCYMEWRRLVPGGPQQLRRQVEAAGFIDITCYWPWPWPTYGNPLFWLPLEAPHALRHFLSTRPPSASRFRQGLRASFRYLWRIARSLHLIAPICVIAYKGLPPIMSTPSEIFTAKNAKSAKVEKVNDAKCEAQLGVETYEMAGLRATIQASWRDWGLGAVPTELRWLLLTGGLRTVNKVVTVVFADDTPEPLLVVKQPRVVESIPGLVREVKALRTVHALRPGGIAGVPQVLFVHHQGQQVAVGESVLTGKPLWTMLRAGNFRKLALAATNWLGNLVDPQPLCPQSIWWERLVEPVLAEFMTNFGAVVQPEQVQLTRRRLATVGALPLACEHRDFSPWNVLIDANEQLAVLDWESAEVQGLPSLDLVYFLAYLTFFHTGAMASKDFRPSYRSLLDRTSPTGVIFQECLAHYATQCGLDSARLAPLRLLVWLIHSRSEYQQLVADAGGPPTPASLRNSLFVALWEEELCQA